jgi:superfamily II DNA or RNA helicase
MVDDSVKRVMGLRTAKNIKLKKLPSRMKPTCQLRSYQAIGAMHMFCMPEFFLSDAPGVGKCLAEDTLVATPRGPVKIQNLKSGDMVYDEFGHPIEVLQLHNQGFQECVNLQWGRLTLATCTMGHKWLTTSNNHKIAVHTTQELRRSYKIVKKELNLPLGQVEEPYAYALGAFLGNGCSKESGIQLSQGNVYVPNKIASILNLEVAHSGQENHTYRFLCPNQRKYIFSDFYETHIRNKYAHEKTVDWDAIKSWNRESLVRFVAGLMDTDGSIYSAHNQLVISFGLQSLDVINAMVYAFNALWQMELNLYCDNRPKYKNGCVWVFSLNNNAYCKRILKELDPHLVSPQKKWLSKYDSFQGSRSRTDSVGVRTIPVGQKQCWDITVKSPTSLYCLQNGLVTHNTLQSITAYAFWLDKQPDMKLLVITVKSAIFQWAEEFTKFTHDINCTPLSFASDIGYESMQHKREAHIEKWLKDPSQHVLIMNYASMLRDHEYLINKLREHKTKLFLICDESNAFKNSDSKIFQALWRVRPHVERIVALSATPIKNRLLEFFAQFKILRPNLFNTKENFEQLFVIKETMTFGKGKQRRKIERILGYKNLNLFTKMIEPYCLGRKKSEKVVVEMTGLQLKTYNDAKKGFLKVDDGKKTKKLTLVSKLVYLQLIADSTLLLNDPIQAPSAKEEEFIRLIQDEYSDEKVVVYTRFRRGVIRLKEVLESVGVKSLCIHGQIGSEDRNKNKNEFWNSKEINVMIINDSAAEAINLQTASVFIFYNLPWSIGTYMQLQGRIHRIGSVHLKNMIVTMMAKNSVDEHTYKTLENKLSLVEQIQGTHADILKSAIKDDITEEILESLWAS